MGYPMLIATPANAAATIRKSLSTRIAYLHL
jgi:hypothetical protein